MKHSFTFLMLATIPLFSSTASADETNLNVGSGVRLVRANEIDTRDGYFAIFENTNNGWKLSNITFTSPEINNPNNSEVLYFSKDLTIVEPDYRTYPGLSKFNGTYIFPCGTGVIRKGSYNPCISSLTKKIPFETSKDNRAIDNEKVLALIRQTNVFERLQEIKIKSDQEYFLKKYRNDYANAISREDLNSFIDMYSKNDPDNLIPQALARQNELKLKEDEENKQREAKQEEERKQREAAEKKQKEYERKRIQQVMVEVESFRRKIKIESETNCGPVLEIKGGLIKIYAPIANYGNEHWIKKNQIFPPGFNCQFYNGQYQPPTF